MAPPDGGKGTALPGWWDEPGLGGMAALEAEHFLAAHGSPVSPVPEAQWESMETKRADAQPAQPSAATQLSNGNTAPAQPRVAISR